MIVTECSVHAAGSTQKLVKATEAIHDRLGIKLKIARTIQGWL